MDIIQYSKEHIEFRKNLRVFCEKEIIPYVDQWEADHIVPREIWQKAGRAGFLCTDITPEYGGRGGDFLYSLIISEELSRTWHTGLAAALLLTARVLWPLARSHRLLGALLTRPCLLKLTTGVPCPFCGADASLEKYDDSLDDNTSRVTCPKEDCPGAHVWEDSEQIAISTWNKRAL